MIQVFDLTKIGPAHATVDLPLVAVQAFAADDKTERLMQSGRICAFGQIASAAAFGDLPRLENPYVCPPSDSYHPQSHGCPQRAPRALMIASAW